MRSAQGLKFAVVAFLALLFLGLDAYAKEKPEIVRCDAQYLDALVRINIQWQSPNPVTVIRAIIGKEQKEVKVDEYDNKRNPDGYWGEATIVTKIAPGMTQDGIPYLIQIEDDLRQKSERVTGNVQPPAGPGKESAGGAWPGGGTQPGGGTWSGGGPGTGGTSWPGGGTPPGSGGTWPGGGTRPGMGTPGGGTWPAGGTSGGKTWSGGVAWPGGGVSGGAGTTSGGGALPGGGAANSGGSLPGGGTPAGSRILQNDGFTPGGRVAFIDGLKTGDEVAVVLGPVDRPFQVTKIAFLCGGSTGTGILTMKLSQDTGGASPGAPLFTESYQLQGADTAIQEIELTGQVPSIPAGGSVRVSFQFQHTGFPSIGYDPTGSAVSKRNWVSKSGAWSDFGAAGIPGNGIVRATVVTQ
jgi:hypothetical protein